MKCRHHCYMWNIAELSIACRICHIVPECLSSWRFRTGHHAAAVVSLCQTYCHFVRHIATLSDLCHFVRLVTLSSLLFCQTYCHLCHSVRFVTLSDLSLHQTCVTLSDLCHFVRLVVTLSGLLSLCWTYYHFVRLVVTLSDLSPHSCRSYCDNSWAYKHSWVLRHLVVVVFYPVLTELIVPRCCSTLSNIIRYLQTLPVHISRTCGSTLAGFIVFY